MEIWLKHSNSDQMLLPVTPSEFQITEKSGNTTVVVNSLGEINLLGKRGLKEGSLSSFFPNQVYQFAQGSYKLKKEKHTTNTWKTVKQKVYSKKRKKYITTEKRVKTTKVYYTEKKVNVAIDKPYAFIKQLLTWKHSGTPVRLLIGTHVNILITIETLEYGEQDGTGDVYYTIVFKEYREIELVKKPAKKKKTTKKKKKKKKAKTKKRNSKKKKKQKTYTVKSGDCLWNIAKKFYGNGSQYTKIYNANRSKIKNPNLIYPGQVLAIP